MPSPSQDRSRRGGLGTAPGVRHRDMHPLTKARVDMQAMVGRRIHDYGEACRLLGTGEATDAYVSRKKEELTQGLALLVEAAQTEVMGE